MSVEELQKALADGEQKAERAKAKSREDFHNRLIAVKRVLEDLPDYLGCTDGQWYDVESKTATGPVKQTLPALIETLPTETDWHVGLQMAMPTPPPASETHLIPLDFTLRTDSAHEKVRLSFAGATFEVDLAGDMACTKKRLFEHVKSQVLNSLGNDHKSGTPIG